MASKKYAQLKNYYLAGLWTIEMLKNAVGKKWITASEFKEITGLEISYSYSYMYYISFSEFQLVKRFLESLYVHCSYFTYRLIRAFGFLVICSVKFPY